MYLIFESKKFYKITDKKTITFSGFYIQFTFLRSQYLETWV